MRALEQVVDFIFEYLFRISKHSITSVFVYACMLQRRITIYAKRADMVTRRGESDVFPNDDERLRSSSDETKRYLILLLRRRTQRQESRSLMLI